MKPLDASTLDLFLQLATERLSGEWTLIGGSVLPALGMAHRPTMDIDLCAPVEATHEQILVLLDLASELGLPPEAINQSASFFLRRVPGYQNDLVVLRKSAKVTIYRPNVTLFLLLKIGRLTESDLEDCLVFLDFAKGHAEPLDLERVRLAIFEAMAKSYPQKRRRLRRLLLAVEAWA